mgnify:CR=1 FL=1
MNVSLNPHISEKEIKIIIDPAPASGSKRCCRPKKSLLSQGNFLIDYMYISSINVVFPSIQFIRQTTHRLTAENTSQVAPNSLAYVYSLRLFCHLELAPVQQE